MKTKFFYSFIFVIGFNLTLQAQSQVTDTQVDKMTFSVEAENVEDLKNIDWASIKAAFKTFSPSDSVGLAVTYKGEPHLESKTATVVTFALEFSDISSRSDNLIIQAKKGVNKLIALEEENSK